MTKKEKKELIKRLSIFIENRCVSHSKALTKSLKDELETFGYFI